MTTRTVGPTSTYTSIAEAMLASSPGDTISLEGSYSNESVNIMHDGLTINGDTTSLGILLQLISGITTFTATGTAPFTLIDASDSNGIIGNAGDNQITVRTGADVVDGGAGRDRLIADYTATTTDVTGGITSGSLAMGYAGRLADRAAAAVDFQGVESFIVITGSGNDIIRTGGSDDVLSGGRGNDILDAGAGNDLIRGGDGDDTLLGGDGDDILNGGLGDDRLEGGAGNDNLNDSEGTNILLGGDGNDVLFGTGLLDGGNGDDRLNAASYEAMMTGEAGRDTFIPLAPFEDALPSSLQLITDFATGTSGDRLDLSNWLTSANATGYAGQNPFAAGYIGLRQDGADTIVRWDNTGGGNSYIDAIRLQNLLSTSLVAENFGLVFNPNVETRITPAPDTLPPITSAPLPEPQFMPFVFISRGGVNSREPALALTDVAKGTQYRVVGTDRDDRVAATEFNDLIELSASNDRVAGRGGNDFVLGGDGFDTAVFRGKRSEYLISTAADGKVTVQDTVAGRDGTDTLMDVENLQFANVPTFRFFHTQAGGHLFTTSEAEAANVRANLPVYRDEGTTFLTADEGLAGAVPVYRFFHTQAGGHLFTTSSVEAESVRANLPHYRDEGVAFNMSAVLGEGLVPIYRFFHTQAGGHLFTSSEVEAANVRATLPVYRDEGVAFYAPTSVADALFGF